MYRQIDRPTDLLVDGQMDGRTDGWMDGRTDGWTDGWTDRWMTDRWKDERSLNPFWCRGTCPLLGPLPHPYFTYLPSFKDGAVGTTLHVMLLGKGPMGQEE